MRVGRVGAYVTREREGRTELLVFDHRDFPEAGTQVPAGGVDAGESLEQALLRELEEEAGLAGVEIVRLLSDEHWESHSFHVRVTGETPDEWTHVVVGDGDDAGLVFVYRWVPLDPEFVLWGTRDPVLRLIDAA